MSQQRMQPVLSITVAVSSGYSRANAERSGQHGASDPELPLGFLFTTPNLGEGSDLLTKDLTPLGAALWTGSQALAASRSAQASA